MTLFTKKEKIILNSELQRDDFIEKLDKAHVTLSSRRIIILICPPVSVFQ